MKYTQKIAVFYPCTYTEYKKGDLHTATEKLISSKPSLEYSFDLFFIFNKPSADNYNSLLKFESRSVINSVYIHSLNLSEEEDLYVQTWKSKKDLPSPIPPHGLSSGPNLSFYNSLYYLLSHSNEYDNFLLIESDVQFTKTHWFDKLLEFCNEDFLIAGSKYKGLNEWHNQLDYKDHLNGIAIYKNSMHLYFLLKESEEYLIQSVNNGTLFINFDIAIDEWRRSEQGKKFFKKSPPLIDTHFITNASDPVDANLTLPEILHLHPETCILHHKTGRDNTSFAFESQGAESKDDLQFSVQSKINSIKFENPNNLEHSNFQKLPIFFNVPQNAGSYITSKIFLYLRAYRDKFNLKHLFGLNKESIFNLTIHKDSIPIFTIIGSDSKSVLDANENIIHNRSIEYQMEFNDFSQDLLKDIFTFCLIVNPNGFNIFDEIVSPDFDSYKKYPFLVLRDPFERVKSKYSYKNERPDFSDYLQSCKYEDSWLIRNLLNVRLNVDLDKIHFDLTSSILEYFKVFSLPENRCSKISQELDYFLDKCFTECWSVSSTDIHPDWLLEENVLVYKSNENSLNINLSELPQNTQEKFLIHTNFSNKLYKKFLTV